MAKITEMDFPEVVIHVTNKIPNDPDTFFNKFADELLTIERNTMGGLATIKLKEIGPRENLSSRFELDWTMNYDIADRMDLDMTIDLRLIITEGKIVEIKFGSKVIVDPPQEEMGLPALEQQIRLMLGYSFRLIYDSVIGKNFTVVQKKFKPPKKDMNEEYLEQLYNPEMGGKHAKTVKMALEGSKQMYERMVAEAAPEGSKCHIHPDKDADKLCDWCKKPVCRKDLTNPFSGQKMYLKKKELDKVPYSCCPNCIDAALKKFGPKSKSQVLGYMAAHR
ncbi:MAG: hypothetical protein ACFFCS_12925 [Candidatus Hodarchaeota archaeon]